MVIKHISKQERRELENHLYHLDIAGVIEENTHDEIIEKIGELS